MTELAPGSIRDPAVKRRLADAAVRYLLAELGGLGVKLLRSPETGSRYLGEPSDPGGPYSVRISDHPGRKRYFYKWNLWLNGKGYWDEVDRRGRESHHYGLNELDRMVNDIRRSADEDDDSGTHKVAAGGPGGRSA